MENRKSWKRQSFEPPKTWKKLQIMLCSEIYRDNYHAIIILITVKRAEISPRFEQTELEFLFYVNELKITM